MCHAIVNMHFYTVHFLPIQSMECTRQRTVFLTIRQLTIGSAREKQSLGHSLHRIPVPTTSTQRSGDRSWKEYSKFRNQRTTGSYRWQKGSKNLQKVLPRDQRRQFEKGVGSLTSRNGVEIYEQCSKANVLKKYFARTGRMGVSKQRLITHLLRQGTLE